jgi:hypothetical protein
MKLRLAIFATLAIIATGCGGGISVNFVDSEIETLTTGDAFANSRYYDVWTFVPNRTGTSTFGMNSPDFFPHLEIEDENGFVIADNDHQGRDSDVEISAFLDINRTYYVIATSAAANQLGDYEVLWESSVDLVGIDRPGPASLKSSPKDGAPTAPKRAK